MASVDKKKTKSEQKTKTPMAELEPTTRAETFDEVARGYTEQEAMQEALRCIQCAKKPCVAGCPVGVPIADFIALVAEGNIADAYALVKSTNSLPAICGRVCPQETQCEGVCTLGRIEEPVAIGRLERFVADWAFDNPQEAAEASEALKYAQVEAGEFSGVSPCDLSTRKVAVVGSGPASLTCAGQLARFGVQVVVFEALHEVGGVLSYGIPEFRLPKELVKKEIASIEAEGVKFETNAFIGKLYEIKELLDEQGFDAVFIGTGAGTPQYLGIEGEGLNGSMVASELLTRVNLMKAHRFPEYATPIYAGKRCVVVGGGNVAMDAARTARRLGAEVTVVYRRSQKEMPARAEEIHHAEEEGIAFKMLSNPVRVLGNDEGWVTGLECVAMELGEPDASGRRSPQEVEGSNFVIDIDMLVVAIGSKTNRLIAETTPGLEITKRNLIVADEESGATSVAGVFAGGDVVIGAATVILAMGAGKRAAQGIATYLCK
ncbi:MAG: NADPH-dependent glutamate synthase [Eggerthellaceae bacterium]|jgi:glutamate synthase (NADPH/NADH) small chain|nr:NADPH-dependent glutamate synthase [Eggerthellaceae bacterium]MDR2721763.1 NADPH-dependent glutamate synthase [Coriobacteriaceae bacterium]